MADNLAAAINPLLQAINKNTETYSKFAEEMRKSTGRGNLPGREGRETRARGLTLEADQLKKSSKALIDLRDAIEDVSASHRLGNKITKKQHRALVKKAEKVEKQGGEVYDANEQLIKQARAYGDAQSDSLTGLAELADGTREALGVQEKVIAAKQKELRTSEARMRSLDKFSDNIQETVSNLITFKSALTQIGGSLILTSNHFNDVIKAQQVSFSYINEGFRDAAALTGMSNDAWTDAMIKNRTLILATSGDYKNQRGALLKWSGTLEEMIPSFQDYAGSADEAGAMIMNASALFTKTAADITHEDITSGPLQKFKEQIQDITKLTNIQGEAIIDQFSGYLDSSEVRKQLLQMDKTERINYPNKLAQEAKYYVAQGKTLEQFVAVQSALAGISQMKPKDRIRQAATIIGVAGAMQMDIDPEMFQILSMNPMNLSEPQKRKKQKFATQLQATTQQQLATEGGVGVATGQLLDKVSGQVFDSLMEMSTAATKGTALTGDQVKASTTNTQALDGVADGLRGLMEKFDNFMNMFQDPSLGLFTGAFTGLLASIKELFMIGLMGKMALMLGVGGLVGAVATIALPITVIAGTLAGIAAIFEDGNSMIADMMRSVFPDAVMDGIGAGLHAVFPNEFDIQKLREDQAKTSESSMAAMKDFNTAQMDTFNTLMKELTDAGVKADEAHAQALDRVTEGVNKTTAAVTKQTDENREIEEKKEDTKKKSDANLIDAGTFNARTGGQTMALTY